MSSFADDMREWIIDMTLNGSLNVFVDYAPDKTDFIACFNTGGRESTIPLDASYIEEHPSVQIICNHIDSSVATYDKCSPILLTANGLKFLIILTIALPFLTVIFVITIALSLTLYYRVA